MKENADIVLVGSRVALVPYQERHVKQYHTWMLDEELRELTASEPLSEDEEMAMMHSWRNDEDKLTFIILKRDCGNDDLVNTADMLPDDVRVLKLPMIGDVNLFIKGKPPIFGGKDDEDDEFEAEIEIMIADKPSRRLGLGQEALQLMLTYATGAHFPPMSSTTTESRVIHQSLPAPIQPEFLVARISQTNVPSIALFGRLGFGITKTVEVFAEVEMRWGKAKNAIRAREILPQQEDNVRLGLDVVLKSH